MGTSSIKRSKIGEGGGGGGRCVWREGEQKEKVYSLFEGRRSRVWDANHRKKHKPASSKHIISVTTEIQGGLSTQAKRAEAH